MAATVDSPVMPFPTLPGQRRFPRNLGIVDRKYLKFEEFNVLRREAGFDESHR